MYIKFPKCEFELDYVKFFDHMILKERVMADPVKVVAVLEWQLPRNTNEVCSFLGLICFYKKFINEFFKITLPLISLTRKGKKFEWTEQCEQVFRNSRKS